MHRYGTHKQRREKNNTLSEARRLCWFTFVMHVDQFPLLQWCGHCKNLAPVWDKLSVAVSDASIVGRDIRIGQVDATLELAQAKRFDVRGYPSLKLFSQGKVYDYKGPRTLEALEKFAKSGGEGVEAKGIPEPPNQMSATAHTSKDTSTHTDRERGYIAE